MNRNAVPDHNIAYTFTDGIGFTDDGFGIFMATGYGSTQLKLCYWLAFKLNN